MYIQNDEKGYVKLREFANTNSATLNIIPNGYKSEFKKQISLHSLIKMVKPIFGIIQKIWAVIYMADMLHKMSKFPIQMDYE